MRRCCGVGRGSGGSRQWEGTVTLIGVALCVVIVACTVAFVCHHRITHRKDKTKQVAANQALLVNGNLRGSSLFLLLLSYLGTIIGLACLTTINSFPKLGFLCLYYPILRFLACTTFGSGRTGKVKLENVTPCPVKLRPVMMIYSCICMRIS